jgi:hypothetical protein
MKSKSKMKKAELKLLQEKEMKKFLERVGYKGGPREPVNEIPDYRTDNFKHTSNEIPGNGVKIKNSRYTGTELLGLTTMHKSNIVPIRKDNKQAAIDAAQMRRN